MTRERVFFNHENVMKIMATHEKCKFHGMGIAIATRPIKTSSNEVNS